MTRPLLLVLGFSALLWPWEAVQAQEHLCGSTPCAYQNTSFAPEIRATDLVHRMTLDEKVGQTMDQAKAIPRLGVPEYNWWNEGLHGVARSGFATVFPQAIALAATWNPSMVHDVADVISTEARARYNEAIKRNQFSRYSGLTYWSPNINIFRDPRWGRGQETYGEDPFLTATTGTAFIHGLQGDNPNYFKIIATPKHFAVHSGPEPARHGFNVSPSAFDLEDTYLPAFRAAITEGKADSIMCAYNAVDGVPACASTMLLQQYLRGSWQFNGYVVSDCDAVGDVQSGHHYAVDGAHASAVSLQAGTDLDCGSAYKELGTAVKQGLVKEEQLDVTLIHLFTARFRLGMFDPKYAVPYSSLSQSDIDSAEHHQLALKAARESIVLLQNRTGILPLLQKQRIAVVGPTAELLQAVEGNYNGASSSPVLPLDGIKKHFGERNVSYSPGSLLAEGMATPIPSTAFRPAAGVAQHGLKAEYFNNTEFSGPAAITRVDRILNFDWENVAPLPNAAVNKISVRWTGVLDVPAAGAYTLSFRGVPRPRKTVDVTGEGAKAASSSEHLLRVFIDDKLLIDSATGETSAAFKADAAGPHSLCVEYVRANNDRAVSLQWVTPPDALLADAIEKAKAADVVIAVVGLSPDLEGEEMNVEVPGFRGGDRTSIDLPQPQERLLEELKKTGKPLIIVLTSGSAVALTWADQNADAILQAWYGGEEAGDAIAETLAGENNPSGRLPVTFYRDTRDLPAFDDYSMANRTYRYFQGPVLYPFGFGLSYSSFMIDKPKLQHDSVRAGDPVTVTTTVSNTSKREGDEVLELYVDAPGGRPGAHPFLAGFQKVHLRAGEAKAVAIAIQPRQLSRVDSNGQRAIQSGEYTIHVGDQQPGFSKLTYPVALHVRDNKVLPK